MRLLLILSIFCLSILHLTAQKPPLDLAAVDAWKAIMKPQISDDGRWVSYVVKPNDGDPTLMVYDTRKKSERAFPRGQKAQFDADSKYVAFMVSPHRDTLRERRRRKVKKKELPKDTLYLLELASGQVERFPNVKGYTLPEKWSGYLAYQLTPPPPDTSKTDSTRTKIKPMNKTNGHHVVIRSLDGQQTDTLRYVKDYLAAKEGPRFLLHSTGQDSSLQAGVYWYDCPAGTMRPVLTGKGQYANLALDERGNQAAFLVYQDTLRPRTTPYDLYYWKSTSDAPTALLEAGDEFLPNDWLLNENQNLQFSENGQRLYFGTTPPPLLQDTTLLDEEIVNVEVWSYTDNRLYTHEEAELEKEKKRAYQAVCHLDQRKLVQLGSPDRPEVRLGDEGNADFALALNDVLYQKQLSWNGFPPCQDVYLLDVRSGTERLVQAGVCGRPKLSPKGEYVYWYSAPDSAWYAYSVADGQTRQLAAQVEVPFYSEINDRPAHPRAYGTPGWTDDDDFILLYDRYDVWLVDPLCNIAPNNLTNGRTEQKIYRYLQLDKEARSIDEVAPMLFRTFRETNKYSGFAWFDLHTGIKDQVQEGPFHYSFWIKKAKNTDRYLFNRENFGLFPDLLLAKGKIKDFQRISDVNPQQADYAWGTIEPYEWVGGDGQPMEGLLIKPDNFDPNKKYPAITYFYERNAYSLYRYRRPRYPRASIIFSYYASRGYVIFVPDIHYRVGYPGESALDAITSGLTKLIDEGFVDRDRIGVQGHSWGGYQAAYLITQTNLFRCAEAGAPVVNMTSAYGGIRWRSGLSRMFQYEQSQSRIGGTLWDKPLRYIENSPLFYADKIETPVLILHNDKDGAVPWYQGIEFFVALRRLGKPAWLLNYNDEAHGILKDQNSRDFHQRLQQFFDHYLMDQPMPAWMREGVPPKAKGIEQGLE